MKSMDEKVLDSESIEFKGNDRKDAKDAVQKAKDLLAKEKITKKNWNLSKAFLIERKMVRNPVSLESLRKKPPSTIRWKGIEIRSILTTTRNMLP